MSEAYRTVPILISTTSWDAKRPGSAQSLHLFETSAMTRVNMVRSQPGLAVNSPGAPRLDREAPSCERVWLSLPVDQGASARPDCLSLSPDRDVFGVENARQDQEQKRRFYWQ